MGWVSLKGVDWTVMLARFETKASLDFNCLSLVGLENITLLSTDQVLKWACVLVVFKTGSTKDLLDWLITNLEGFVKDKFIYWTISEFLHIPPKDSTVS